MIVHSIDAARQAKVFDRIVVSTDDRAIADAAIAAGAEVPFMRPAHLADDHTGITDVVAHAVDWLAASGESLDAICCLSATAPLMRPDDIRAGLHMLGEGDWQ